MSVIAYIRVSTDDQTTENQRRAIESRYSVSKWFVEQGVSGAIPALQRPALTELLSYVRENDLVATVELLVEMDLCGIMRDIFSILIPKNLRKNFIRFQIS